MKTILISLLVVLTLAAVPVSAQTYLTTTTLSSSITSTQTQFQVASATNVEAGGALYVDHELMNIVSVSSTTVTVTRTQKPMAHASGAQVFVVKSAYKPFTLFPHDGARRAGQCSTSTSSTRATALANIGYLPIIDVDTGDVYDCRRNGVSGAWVWNIIQVEKFNSVDGSTWAQ